AGAGRLLEADPHGALRRRDPGLSVSRERDRRVPRGVARRAEPVPEERAAADARAAPVQLEARCAEYAARVVVLEMHDLDARERAPERRDVDAEDTPRRPEVRALPVLEVEARVDVAAPRRTEGHREVVLAVEHRQTIGVGGAAGALADRERHALAARAVEV